jgi:hypothetical protein
MAFNSHTYHANRYRREAWAYLAQARDIKARVLAGTAYSWEAARIPTMVQLARITLKLSRGQLALKRIGR